MIFGSRIGFSVSGSANPMAADGHLGCPKMAITSQPICRSTWCLAIGRGFRLSLDLFPRGLHTRTAVARNPCVSWDFLLLLLLLFLIIILFYILLYFIFLNNNNYYYCVCICIMF